MVTVFQNMRIDHRYLDTLMTQQLLNRADVIAGFQQMRRKGMPESVRIDMFGQIYCSLKT